MQNIAAKLQLKLNKKNFVILKKLKHEKNISLEKNQSVIKKFNKRKGRALKIPFKKLKKSKLKSRINTLINTPGPSNFVKKYFNNININITLAKSLANI